MRYEVRSIGIWSLLKVGFFLNLMIGFLFGIFASLVFIPIARVFLVLAGVGEMPYDGGTSFGMLFFLPFLTAILGAFFNTLFMVLVAACYNLVARIVGGIEFNLNSLPDGTILNLSMANETSPSIGTETTMAAESAVLMPPLPPPFRPTPVVPEPEPTLYSESESAGLPDELPVKIRQSEEDAGEKSPIVEPHTEPDEDGPRQDNP